MKGSKPFVALIVIILSASILLAQDQKPANLAASAPNVALLDYQNVFPGKAADRKKLMAALSRACDRADTPKYWIDLESLTGDSGTLVLYPFDSYEHLEQSTAEWDQFLAAHPELSRMKREIAEQLGSYRNATATRRDDLGYLAENVDLSEMRFVSILEVRVFPGHEDDFANAFKILADAYAKIHLDAPWIVYEIDSGTSAPTFLVLRPMSELKQVDDLRSASVDLAEAEGEQSVETLRRIAREAYASSVSNLYSVNPEMSHVSNAFASADPNYWLHRIPAEVKSEAKPGPNPAISK